MKRITLCFTILGCAVSGLQGQAIYPSGGSGSYVEEHAVDYDIYNIPSKIIGWCGQPMPNLPCSLDYKLNADGHFPRIATDRRKYPITPKVTADFSQHFASPEWWTPHIWNFLTNTETRSTLFPADTNMHGTPESDLSKSFTAAYGTSTHPHPLVFNNRGYGFGISQYGAATYTYYGSVQGNASLGYDFGTDFNVSMGAQHVVYDDTYLHLRQPNWVNQHVGTRVKRYGDWTATVIWPYTSGDTLEVTSGRGMPFAQCRVSEGVDTINFGHTGTFSHWATTPNAIGVSFDRFNTGDFKHYGIFYPGGAQLLGNEITGDGNRYFCYTFDHEGGLFADIDTNSWTRTGYASHWQDYNNDGIIDSNYSYSCFRLVLPPGRPYFSIAALPDSNPATLAAFEKRAFAYVTDSRVSFNYDMAAARVNVTFTVETELVPGAPAGSLNETAQALYMHQYKHSAAGIPNKTYRTPRGPMQLHYGNSFDAHYRHLGLIPDLGWAMSGDSAYIRANLDSINKVYDIMYDQNPYGWDRTSAEPFGFYGETYEQGKFMNKYADLLPLCRYTGHTQLFNKLLADLKENLEDWLDASDYNDNYGPVPKYDPALTAAQNIANRDAFIASKTPDEFPFGKYRFLVYSARASSLAGYPTGHYAASNLNDHQLHWGYFIKTAAMIARYDPIWAQQWGPMVEMLIRDANSWMRNDPLFPFMRHFDAYAGHGWISGRPEGRTGLDIESASEAINCATATAFWGAATNQPEIRDWGIFVATLFYHGYNYYWNDMDDDVHDPAYPDKAVGLIWGAASNYELFFTANPHGKNAISWLPITAASLYLGYNRTHMNDIFSEIERKERKAMLDTYGVDYLWKWDDETGRNPTIPPDQRMKGWRSLLAQYKAMFDVEWAKDMEKQLMEEYQGWETIPPLAPDTYGGWYDGGAIYSVNTGFEGLHPSFLHQFIYTMDSCGVVDSVWSDWATTQVLRKDTCNTWFRHYFLYNPPNEPERVVTFSDGTCWLMPEDTTVVYNLLEPDTIGPVKADKDVVCLDSAITLTLDSFRVCDEDTVFLFQYSRDLTDWKTIVRVNSGGDSTAIDFTPTSVGWYYFRGVMINDYLNKPELVCPQHDTADAKEYCSVFVSACGCDSVGRIKAADDAICLGQSTRLLTHQYVIQTPDTIIQFQISSNKLTWDSLAQTGPDEAATTLTWSPVSEGWFYFRTVMINEPDCANDTARITMTGYMDSVLVARPPFVSLAAPDSICQHAPPITLSGTPPGGVFAGPGIIENTLNPDLTDHVEVTVSYTVTDTNQCFTTESQTINMLPSPVVHLSDTSVCEGRSIVVDTKLSEPGMFTWSTGDSVNPLTLSPTSTLTYTVTATLPNGCTASDEMVVAVNQLPIPAFSTNTHAGCAPLEVLFTGDAKLAGTLHTWDFGDNQTTIDSSGVASHSYTGSGDYDVILSIKTAAGCYKADTFFHAIEVFSPPVARFDYQPKDPNNLKPKVSFEDLSIGDVVSYHWHINDLDASYREASPVHTFSAPGTYNVSLTVENEFCDNSHMVLIHVQADHAIYIPNAFTPGNHDGVNDTFRPIGIGIRKEGYHFSVFSRWGEHIYVGNQLGEGWNGRKHNVGAACPEGVYSWLIEYLDMENHPHKIRGKVTIAR